MSRVKKLTGCRIKQSTRERVSAGRLKKGKIDRDNMSYQRIVIVGFMAAGKTTVAHDLARQLNCSGIDLDDRIAERKKRTAKEIIEQDGEDAFRKIETQALSDVLLDAAARVIAIGGGAWTVAENRSLIAEHGGFTVWLDAPFELCWKRIEAKPGIRPLARSQEMAQKLYAQRRPLYETADVRVSVSENESAEQIAMKIVDIVLVQSADS